MTSTSTGFARLRPAGLILGLGALLAGCSNQLGGFGQSGAPLSAPTTPVTSEPLEGSENMIGSGPVRIGLILPLTQNGQPSVVGTALRNSVELAMIESGSTDVSFIVKDDHSSPEGAREAATQVLAEGAEMIVGPLFATSVRQVGQVARPAGKPVIAFSTDTGSAARGVYLLSFLIENYVDRIVHYAASRGKKSIAALAPENDYGNVALAAFQSAAANAGLRVMAIERYNRGSLNAAVQRIAALGPQIDSLFIPEQAEGMPAVAQALTRAGLISPKVQILGTGVWNDARALGLPALQGAWFATPENNGFNAFAARYRARFGSDPTRIATLAYDAGSLASALARTQGSQRFEESVLTNPAGFNGADGIFRFRSDGQNERGLAVLQIGSGSTTTVSPAPRSFGAGGT